MTYLSGLDATFLSSETPNTPMNTLKVLVLERERSDRRSARAFIHEGLRRAIRRLPAMRVRPIASGRSRPRWEDVPVDLARHVSFAKVFTRDGDIVDRATAAHLEGLLPRDRPLWSLLVLEHVGTRRLTLSLKYHHALADGVGFARMLDVLAGRAEPIPHEGAPQLGSLSYMRELLALLFVSARGLWRSLAHRPVTPFSGGRWAFNGPVGPRRRVALARLSFARLQEARSAAGAERATINDVLLTLLAGALRRLGREAGEDLSRPLIVAQPVALAGEPHDRGNHLSSVLAPLHVEIGDARERLRRTQRSTRAAKAAHEARGRDLVARWSELLPAVFLRGFWAAIRRLPRPPANVVVSNVPGATEVLPLGRARLEEVYIVGPLLPTTGLNVTFYRHADTVHVCVLASDACEPRALAQAIEAALDELTDAEAREPRDSLAA